MLRTTLMLIALLAAGSVVADDKPKQEPAKRAAKADARAAADWLEKYAMMPRARAEQRVKFFEQYRSYVINYNLGKDLVRTFIERRTKTDGSPRRRWTEFAALLSSPRLPSGLK